MFLEKYLNATYLDLIYSNYNEEYLNTLEEDNFLKIYNLFKSYSFYFIDDIILKYLEIFDMDYNDVLNGIINLKNKLGDNFIYIIGNDMTYLEEIFNEEETEIV